jgi:A/G-specific adenine glycosylase
VHSITPPALSTPLLAWYDANKRTLPFRTHSTPYRVWVSEIMLQQTRVSAALPYYERFMEALPTVADLAQCPPERLAKLWEGLGYYSRARNLQKAAQIIMEQYNGELPQSFDALRALPGIGEYTAGAIASICFNACVPAVDGNVLRVFARLLNCAEDIRQPATKRTLTAHVMLHQPPARPGDYNQALMELGALVCIPGGAPLCGSCPLASVCAAQKVGTQGQLPVKTPLKSRKIVPYTVVLVLHGHRVLLNQRPAEGLLAGLWQPLLLEGHLSAQEAQQALAAQGLPTADWQPAGSAKHVFSHLEWHMTGYVCTAQSDALPPQCAWVDADGLAHTYALPGAFRHYRTVLNKLL